MDYATVADVKSWLSITSNGDDALLARLITAESARIDEFLNRKLSSENYDIVFSGNGKNTIVFQQYPITAVQLIEIDGVGVPAYSSATGYGYQFSSWRIALVGRSFTWGIGNCHVKFTAGLNTIPKDVEQACIELVSLRYRERDRIGHASKSLGGETVSFVTSEMTDSILQKLNKYKRTMTAAWGSY